MFLYTVSGIERLLDECGYTDVEVRYSPRIQPSAFEGRPPPWVVSARKEDSEAMPARDETEDLTAIAGGRLASLLVTMRQDLLRLNDLRAADRTVTAQQLKRWVETEEQSRVNPAGSRAKSAARPRSTGRIAKELKRRIGI